MIPAYEIICIKRPRGLLQRYFPERITDIGYKNNTPSGIVVVTIQRAIDMISNKECSFYVSDNGHKVNVHVVNIGTLSRQSYLRTMANGVETDNLENLSECP